MRRTFFPALAILLAACVTPSTHADDETPYPVAISWWGGSMVTIQTFSGLDVGINPFEVVADEFAKSASIEIGLSSSGRFDRPVSNLCPSIGRTTSRSDSFLNPSLQYFNADGVRATSVTGRWDAPDIPDNAMAVRSFDVKGGASASSVFLVSVDGVQVLHVGDAASLDHLPDEARRHGDIDVLCIPLTLGAPAMISLVESADPRVVIPMHAQDSGAQALAPFLDALPDKYEVVHANGNTLAASAAGGPTRENPQVVVLGYKPWSMPADMAALIEAKEAACKKSQETFTKLRVDQLNHKPSNGTHTPRWNAEHMLSAELFFFSNIYSQVDPSIQPVRLFPKQMPPQYEAAHPEWNGRDEAMQMQRVQDFTRRFAYLLEGMDLDELPAGAPPFVGDLRGLFKQMENHYGEHTANVHDKYELEDWPE